MSAIDFSKLPRPAGLRPSYARTLAAYHNGLLSLGFLWETAKNDEVFGALLRRERIEKP